MIEIKNKKDCCGCTACAIICPVQCISMNVDEEGFAYPHADPEKCINCSLCDKVCPHKNVGAHAAPLRVLASRNRDENVRDKSSSGGVFTLLAQRIIADGGVVFGVAFDEKWNAVFTHTDTCDGLAAYRGSKYVQACMGRAYAQAQHFLKDGRKVLFTGTACQVAGLRRFLRKDYPNLFLVEVLCHGVPSPKVWQHYLNIKRHEFNSLAITGINFRDKRNGWYQYAVTITFEHGHESSVSHKKDPYFQGFIKNRYLRPSCYSCQCKNGRAGSDLVIADYWSIKKALPHYADNRGTSLVLINTQKGNALFDSVAPHTDSVETSYDRHLKKNKGFAEHLRVPVERDLFFKRFATDTAGDVFHHRPTLLEKIKALIHRI